MTIIIASAAGVSVINAICYFPSPFMTETPAVLAIIIIIIMTMIIIIFQNNI